MGPMVVVVSVTRNVTESANIEITRYKCMFKMLKRTSI
jgi:hypothetical protein